MSYKPTGSFKQFLDAGKSVTRVISSVERHVLAKPRGLDGRRTNVLHPSEMVDPSWCHRASYFHLLGEEPASRNFSFKLLSVFEEGHSIHAKWQTWFKEMGNLWGKWYCNECGETFWGRPVDHDASISPEFYDYKEVPLDYPELKIAGHADGLLLEFGDPLMLEIKSIGSGTLRYEVAELFKENNYDFDKTWKQVDQPFMKHVTQVQIYMKLAELLKLEHTPQEAVIIYESKATQDVKEFIVPKSDFSIAHIFEAAKKVVDAVNAKVPPECNIANEGCSKCKGYTHESN